MKFLVINGPNLNFIGIREPLIYGDKSYNDLTNYLNREAKAKNISLEIFQSNYEGAIIDKLQEAYYNKLDGVIINPGAFTHYSYAILDAIKSIMIPTVEVHLSDISKREAFRANSVIREACVASIMGKGFKGYNEAMDYLISIKNKNEA